MAWRWISSEPCGAPIFESIQKLGVMWTEAEQDYHVTTVPTWRKGGAGLQLACARERLRLETANREAAERRLTAAQSLLARLLPSCRPQAATLCDRLEGEEKAMLQELMCKEDQAAPQSEQLPHHDPQPRPYAPGTQPEEREQEQQRQQQRPADNNFTNDEWSSCVKVLRLIASNVRLFTDHIVQLAFARRIFLRMVELEQSRELPLVPKAAGGVNRRLDLALMRSTELRKRHIEDIERLKRELPSAFEFSYNRPAIEWISEENGFAAVGDTLSGQCDEVRADNVSSGLDPTGQFFATERIMPAECMICHASYHRVHIFYGDKFCPACSQLNWTKRNATADLTGRLALVTGGRIKIGLETALILLRCGATVYEKDFGAWKDRLHILMADFRDIRAVEALVEYLSSHLPRLDIIINNAAQTIARPAQFYEYLRPTEAKPNSLLPPQQRELLTSEWNDGRYAATAGALTWRRDEVVAPTEGGDDSKDDDYDESGAMQGRQRVFPLGVLTSEGEQVDLREKNSWSLHLDEVSTREFLEVQAVNAIAPFLINGRLRGLMKRSPPLASDGSGAATPEAKFIVNAALNMMTRTSGPDYAADGIYMTSVDTGWVTDENPWPVRLESGFCPPLDCKDGAARVVDPILTAIRGEVSEPAFGLFFKDYKIAHW
ncbi:shortchain dehydrogenase [Acanthamoeba castellanii str. Neff]|uniref:Shortchain dehydrogenase n=1 Tax=Acanthamoeba castellanii (strain ATCC 30010 / Neff) TaxID=1257118 RepID=L8GUQ3_ACACF|nr:shortchain dehydrogenase [Acanthamoeba castellanii str. Neff]ELR16919.1 shortchain dehydrogenase [Acanthamoeba castellanii str. Neff]